MKPNTITIAKRAFSLLFIFTIAPMLMLTPSLVHAKSMSCFSEIDYATPEPQKIKRALYVLVDETVPLTKNMKKRVVSLLSEWGKPGDMVKIARFSASYRDLYPELVYVSTVEIKPGERYMYNLSYKDKKKVLACLDNQKMIFKESFAAKLNNSLKAMNPKIPKSELLGSLKLLSKHIYLPDEAIEKTVFLITDGMENSTVTSFYAKGKMRNIKPRKEISKVRRKGMMGYWKKSNVYIYGLGLMPDKKSYAKPEVVNKLKMFWEQYFVESGAKVRAIGSPELLLTAIE